MVAAFSSSRGSRATPTSQQIFDPSTWSVLVKSGYQRVKVALWQAPAVQPSTAPSRAVQATTAASQPAASPTIAQGVDTAVPGAIGIGHNKLARGAYTYIHLDRSMASPCDGSPLRDVLLWNPSIGDPLILRAFAGRHVLLHGSFSCPVSGVQFAPDSANQPWASAVDSARRSPSW